MGAKQQQIAKARPGKKSKRQRRMQLVVYIMIIAMLLSSITTGLVMFL
ncbi:stressosome-associated protein Prli42 [Virgibacillus halophilus]|uniref:Stressosome-associated protein Prli42 n=1 Tax=Tigheibacillus halophilus TaxID=361280 RepID=A0ABU5CB96_9BACI|nr:stressosome-associated protein Prli42 [Virgibacillus halophilus]